MCNACVIDIYLGESFWQFWQLLKRGGYTYESLETKWERNRDAL
jgi:hypothetical protein